MHYSAYRGKALYCITNCKYSYGTARISKLVNFKKLNMQTFELKNFRIVWRSSRQVCLFAVYLGNKAHNGRSLALYF